MQVQAMTVDAAGNVYLAGTSADGFPGATRTFGPRGGSDWFVIKTNSAGDQILYALSIGGSAAETLRSIRADVQGNLYVLGSSTSPDFPSVTQVNPTFPIGAMLVKINSGGTALTYATQMGSQMIALALDVDSAGAAFVSGITNSQALTTTAGVILPAPIPGAGPADSYGFIVKLNPAGTAFEIATYFGNRNQSVEQVSIRANGILILSAGRLTLLNNTLASQAASVDTGLSPANLAFDTQGNIYLAGTRTSAEAGFALRKFAANGLAQMFDKNFPLVSTTAPPRIAIAANGRIYLFGQAVKPDFPTKNATQPCLANIAAPNGLAGLAIADNGGGLVGAAGGPIPPDQTMTVLDTNGDVLHATFIPAIVAQAAVAPTNGRVYTAASQILFTTPQRGTWRGIVRFNQETIPATRTSPSCVVHGAYFTPVPLTPGALMTIFGDHLGPPPFTSFQLDANNRVPTSLAGVSVTVDNRPAPMLFTYEKQINFIVPWATRTDGAAVPVCVTFDGATTCVQASTGVTSPGAFQCGTVSCAINEDYTQNLPNNGADKGSYVAVYMTGYGTVDGTVVDGGVSDLPLQPVRGTVTASTEPPPQTGCGIFVCSATGAAATSVEVAFAGAAPFLVQGVNQVNFRIPPDMPSGLQSFTLSFLPTGAKDPVATVVKIQVK